MILDITVFESIKDYRLSKISKKCTKCGEVQMLRFFHKMKQGKHGRRSQCKKCVKILSEDRVIKGIVHKTAIRKEYLASSIIEKSHLVSMGKNKCQRCMGIFPLSFFRFNKKTSRLENTCKNCLKENTAKYIKKHPDRVAYKEWFKNNIDRTRKSARKSYHKNIDKRRQIDNLRVQQLVGNYVAKSLGLSIKDCPAELIELKRAQLKLYRATR